MLTTIYFLFWAQFNHLSNISGSPQKLVPRGFKTRLSMQFLFSTPVTDVRFNEPSYASQLDHHKKLRTVWSLQFLSAQVRLSEAKDTSGMELITRVKPKPSSIMQGHQSARTNYSSRRKLSCTVAHVTLRHSVINWKLIQTLQTYTRAVSVQSV